MEPYDEQEATDAAWAFLRSNTTATLRFGEHMHDVSYVISPSGVMVIPAMVAMLQPCDTTMFVPRYVDDCMELHVTLRQFHEEEEGGLLADRWQVYHGTSPDVQWATVEIDAARFHEMFIDGEGLHRENPLAKYEAGICKELNANHVEHLKSICKARTTVDVIAPVVVGVDPQGIDIRASFGIVHVPSDSAFSSTDDVIKFVLGS